jgi:single-strand DNA-binding protein
VNGIACALQGRLGGDPELRFAAQGTAMLSFSVAVQDDKRDDGTPAEWVRVTCWAEAAEQLADRLKKGDEVYVEGRVKLWQGQGRDGVQKAGLSVSAWLVQALGKIGRQARSKGVRALGVGVIDDRPVAISRRAL